MEVIQNGSTPNDHLGLDTSQINDKLYIFLCGWKTHPSGHVVVFSSQFWDLSTLSLTPLTPLTHPPPLKKIVTNTYNKELTYPHPKVYIWRWFSFSRWVGYVLVPWKVTNTTRTLYTRLPLGRSAKKPVGSHRGIEETPSDQCFTSWWFQIFFIFTPTWGRFPFWLIFLGWLKPPTSWVHLGSSNFGLETWVAVGPTLDPIAVVETPSAEKDERRFHRDGIFGRSLLWVWFFFSEKILLSTLYDRGICFWTYHFGKGIFYFTSLSGWWQH